MKKEYSRPKIETGTIWNEKQFLTFLFKIAREKPLQVLFSIKYM